jgi:hypothetical protein
MPSIRNANLSRPQRNAPRTKLDWEIPYFGQLDTTSDPSGMSEVDSPDELNTVYDSVQALMTRKGYTKVLTTAAPSFIGGMYGMYKSDGTKQLVFGSGTDLRKYDNAGSSTKLSGTPTNFTADKQWNFDEYLDKIYAGNGADSLISYDGSGYSVVNSGVSPQYVKVHKNRVYCANFHSSTLYFSDAGNPNSFPVNNFIQINTNDGQNITGIAEILDNLIIFKDDSVWILAGDPLGAGNLTTIGNLQLRQANGTGGCSAFQTIQKVDQTLFFMHVSGIYALQNYSISLVSPFLNTTFKSGMNQNFLNLCWAVYNKTEKKYILGFPSATSSKPDHTFVYDFITKGYTIWDHMPFSCAVNYRFSGLTESVVAGDNTLGNIYQLFQGYADIAGDNGTADISSTTTKLVDLTKNWTVNQFKDCRVGIIVNNQITYTSTVTSNDATSLTLSTALPVASGNQQYTIGYYDSYWTTKNFDFGMVGYSKKYRFFNLFVDAEPYNILFGFATDFAPLAYQKQLQLSTTALIWGQTGAVWGTGTWGNQASLFAQANIGSTGRYIRIKFGNNRANQPWRAIKASISYKLKKERPNIVTT